MNITNNITKSIRRKLMVAITILKICKEQPLKNHTATAIGSKIKEKNPNCEIANTNPNTIGNCLLNLGLFNCSSELSCESVHNRSSKIM